MVHRAAALISFLVLAATVHAQEVVRLRSGKHIAGSVRIDEVDKEGFRVERWDTGAVVYIRWTQIPEAERCRLLGKPAETSAAGVFIDGVRILTTTREVIGLLAREEPTQVQVKTKDSKAPVVIPKAAIMRRDALKIAESEAYSSDEMVDNRAVKADATSAAAMLELAKFSQGLKLYERAKGFLEKALAADSARKEEFDALIQANDLLIMEGKAAAALVAIRALLEKREFEKAIAEAEKLLADYGETQMAKVNSDLVASIQREQKLFMTKRADWLAQNAPDRWRARRSKYINEAAAKTKFAEARAFIPKIDDLIQKDLAKELDSPAEEIAAAWEKREQKPKTVSYSKGSWIAKGGQDGGLDTNETLDPNQPQTPQQGGGGGFGRIPGLPGGTRGGGNQGRPPQKKAIPLGKKLQTSQEWWAAASTTDRRSWIEAEYANVSSFVKKVEKSDQKKCPQCKGQGVGQSSRQGKLCEVICPECHGVKEEVAFQYW